ncbi:MAG: hypothetical protein E6G64_17990 [Actinobacteria bacterium]|nr:MAG: hypothetical protein E6G64_17990 [Actinomycetota bacterium]
MWLAGVSGVGSTNRHVAPESVLIATPQSVPTKTLFGAPGWMPMPIADGSLMRGAAQLKPAGVFAAVGVAVAGCVQVVPPSVLTLIPARLTTRPS